MDRRRNFLLIPDAMANLSPVPDGLTDEQVLMCPDIMSTGFGGAESGGIRIGDAVAGCAQGPIGRCATAGAKLMGATTIIGVETVPERIAMAKRMGADHVVDFRQIDTRPLVTHRFTLDQIEAAYELFSQQCDGVLKVAITP